MTIYNLPTEPSGPVWLYVGRKDTDGPVRYYRVDGPAGPRWCNDAADELSWVELLALGDVDDEYPGVFDLHETATPWQAHGRTITDAAGEEVCEVRGSATGTEADEVLAALIVRLVNHHVARPDAAPDPFPAAAVDPFGGAARRSALAQERRDNLALAVNELALNWRIAPVELRVQVAAANDMLVQRLDRFVDAHAALNRP